METDSDSWKSPSSVYDSDADPLYEPENKKRKTQKRSIRKRGRTGSGKLRSSLAKNSSCSDEDKPCDTHPSTSGAALAENALLKKLEVLEGKKRRLNIRTTFVTDLEKEPFHHGVADLPPDFQWTDKEPPQRIDFFLPLNQPGHTFKGDELPCEIFLSFYDPALMFLVKAMNETGVELVEAGRMRSFPQ